MPFGMFVGVSNHFESVIFAGVFLTNEKEENFCWAFKQFVAMMGGKHPVTILTGKQLFRKTVIACYLHHVSCLSNITI